MRVFLLGAPLLLVAAGGKETCVLGPIESVASQQQAAYHTASLNAETLAASSRRRSVAPGQPGMPAIPQVNFIDTWVFAKAAKDNVALTTLSSDEEFLRRIYLDLTGVIPDSAAVTDFVNDQSADKRAKKIDELLASDAFVDRWTMWFGDLVQSVLRSTNS
ncbi:MAG: DUF1549 domain-containing protein, partial [Vicinamibacteria bacterium]